MLVDRGLWLYGRGDVEGAMRHWLAACRTDPKNTRAAGYVAFASEHDGIDPRTIRSDHEDLDFAPDPIGPPRKSDVPEWVPNPPPEAEGALIASFRAEVEDALVFEDKAPPEAAHVQASAPPHEQSPLRAAVAPEPSQTPPRPVLPGSPAEIEARWNPPQPPPDEISVTYKPRDPRDSGSFDAATVAHSSRSARPGELDGARRADNRGGAAPADNDAPHTDPEIAAGLRQLREHLRADDFSSAVTAADRILEGEPSNEEALRLRAKATDHLSRILEAKIGDLRAIPVLRIPADEVIWLNLSHREGFILSQIDGVLRYEDILDVCGMPRFEALRVLAHLTQDKVIGPSSPP